MDYFSYVLQIADQAELLRSDQDWGALIPPAIDYAEQRIYRELDFLNTRVTSTDTSVSSSGRSISLSTTGGTYIVVESMSAVSTTGTRSQMVPVTKEFIDAVYPNTSTAINSVPQYFAPVTDQLFLIGPPADATYNIEVRGTVRPTPLSSSNTTTFLTTYCPDLLVAASLVFLSEQAERKAMFEGEYQKLMASANQEQLRQRYEGAAWTPMEPAAVTPPRV